jgi:hypothetical protein
MLLRSTPVIRYVAELVLRVQNYCNLCSTLRERANSVQLLYRVVAPSGPEQCRVLVPELQYVAEVTVLVVCVPSGSVR